VKFHRIVGLGLCVVDHTFVVDRFDLSEVRLRYTDELTSSGGMIANALVQCALLGCNTHALSIVGDDAAGRSIARDFQRAGVKTRRLILSPELPTTRCVVLVKRRGGERRFIVPDRQALERRAPDLDVSVIDRRTILLVDGHFPRQALRAARRARACGAAVIGDFHTPTPSALRLLPYVDYPVVPQEFAAAYCRGSAERALRALRAEGGGIPVVTLGRRGGLYLESGAVRRYRARRTRTVDTTGAGDAFHGGFAAGLYLGHDLAGALDLAAQAAAHNCTALGARGRLMTREEMEA
jgi:sulfofructose kinase